MQHPQAKAVPLVTTGRLRKCDITGMQIFVVMLIAANGVYKDKNIHLRID